MVSPVITLQLNRLATGAVQVLVLKSPTGQPSGQFTPPYSEPQYQAVALALEAIQFKGPSWHQVRDAFQALQDLDLADDQGFREDLRERIGRTLFDALLPPGDVREALHAALNAASAEQPARVELRLGASDAALAAYPWELLFEDNREFLFAGGRAALIRYVACPLPVPALLETDKLNLLLVTARPVDPMLPLLPDAESTAVQYGLNEPKQQGLVNLDHLSPVSPAASTWDLLNEYLIKHENDQPPHVFHFDGHGGFGRRCPLPPEGCGTLNRANATICKACGHRLDGKAQGYLAFESTDKGPHWVSAQEVGNLLVGRGVRLAVLTACKSAVMAGGTVFSAMAPALIRAGVPAVVAMQFSVTAEAATRFTRSFYLSIGQRNPLTVAVGQARAALFADRTAWYRPVLYLRTDDDNPEGRLFSEAIPAYEQQDQRPEKPVRAAPEASLDPLDIAERVKSIHVDREEELAEFHAMIEERSKAHVLFIEAGPGMGKSMLLDKFLGLAQDMRLAHAMVDLGNSSENTFGKIFRKLCDQLRGASFSDFEALSHSFIKDAGLPVARSYYHSIDRAMQQTSPDERKTWRGALIEAFFGDLEAFHGRRNEPIVIMFDTYQAADGDVRAWMSQQFIDEVQHYPWLICVVAGHVTPRIDLNEGWCLRSELQPLGEKHIREFLRHVKLVQNEGVITFITKHSKGIPLDLSQLALTLATTEVDHEHR